VTARRTAKLAIHDMLYDRLAQDLYTEICRIPLVDSHTHLDPFQPAAKNLDQLLGHHYYAELAHSSGMERDALAGSVDPRERVRAILYHAARFDNTAPYQWFVEIARAFLNFQGTRLTTADASWLCEAADRLMALPDWEARVLRLSNLEKVFVDRKFDDPLEGLEANRYVPCLRADDLVLHFESTATRDRLQKIVDIEPNDAARMEQALAIIVERFTERGCKACIISLPGSFVPWRVPDADIDRVLGELTRPRARLEPTRSEYFLEQRRLLGYSVLWRLAELCNDFKLPLHLMLAPARGLYQRGQKSGQDLFDQRWSLVQFADLFNSFPDLKFCVSLVSSDQNQELVAFSWVFPNVLTNGHWWYAGLPVYLEADLRSRLQAIPKTKQIGYFSDMYHLEFALPKFNMYRRVLAQILANDFIRPRLYTEPQAVELARLLLHENPRRIYDL
jgi:glucuronate isomerase